MDQTDVILTFIVILLSGILVSIWSIGRMIMGYLGRIMNK